MLAVKKCRRLLLSSLSLSFLFFSFSFFFERKQPAKEKVEISVEIAEEEEEQGRRRRKMGKTIHNVVLNRQPREPFGFRIIGGKDEGLSFKVNYDKSWHMANAAYLLHASLAQIWPF